jgi:hypothetical protein
MWWRTLGMAAVLLCVGVAGGYAVADRTSDQPSTSAAIDPVPAVSPAVPTTAPHPVLPDPSTAPLEPDIATHPEVLRLPRRGGGVIAQVPDGWRVNPSGDTWTFAQEGNPLNTYGLRVQLLFGQRQSVAVVKGARIAALEQSQDQGNMFELDVTAESDDAFEASYIDSTSYRRVTAERYVAFDGDTAYVVVAATGRTVDTEGLRDLVSRCADSMLELAEGEKAPG